MSLPRPSPVADFGAPKHGAVRWVTEEAVRWGSTKAVRRSSWGSDGLGRVDSRTNEMHRTQDSYESVSCNCRAVCSLGASACAWGVGDLEGRSAAKPCRLPALR